jgi:molecular chaperone DnaJ
LTPNIYAILAISPNASADEIRSAYRRLAKEFHPDHYAGGSEKFKDIQEAYSVPGNSRRRREYEQYIKESTRKTTSRRAGYPEPEPLITEERISDLREISSLRSFQSFTPSFDELFDWLKSCFL